jgi:hypothetical protein
VTERRPSEPRHLVKGWAVLPHGGLPTILGLTLIVVR